MRTPPSPFDQHVRNPGRTSTSCTRSISRLRAPYASNKARNRGLRFIVKDGESPSSSLGKFTGRPEARFGPAGPTACTRAVGKPQRSGENRGAKNQKPLATPTCFPELLFIFLSAITRNVSGHENRYQRKTETADFGQDLQILDVTVIPTNPPVENPHRVWAGRPCTARKERKNLRPSSNRPKILQ